MHGKSLHFVQSSLSPVYPCLFVYLCCAMDKIHVDAQFSELVENTRRAFLHERVEVVCLYMLGPLANIHLIHSRFYSGYCSDYFLAL